MNLLYSRDIDFLRESNAIEDIVNIDYRLPQNCHRGKGHAGAYLDSQAQAANGVPVTVDDLCRWQRWITQEQVNYGHYLPAGGGGVLRSPTYPHNVRVGSHVAPTFAEVVPLISNLLADLNRRIAALSGTPDDIDCADTLGEFLQRFEAIHPFVDGNGRTGRLLANYIATTFRLPVVVFRLAERTAFFEAHRSKMAMRIFMSDKVREAILWPGRGILERQSIGISADIYDGLVIERHALLKKRKEWCDADSQRQRNGSI